MVKKYQYENGLYETHFNFDYLTDEVIGQYAAKAQMTKDEATDSLKRFYENLNKQIDKLNYASSAEYLDWLYNFTKRGMTICDDDPREFSEKDKEKLEYLSHLQRVIEEIAEEIFVDNITDKQNEFEILNFVFIYRDKIFEISTMVGQGAITFVRELERAPYDRDVIELNPV